jgi:hypothetical protein
LFQYRSLRCRCKSSSASLPIDIARTKPSAISCGYDVSGDTSGMNSSPAICEPACQPLSLSRKQPNDK